MLRERCLPGQLSPLPRSRGQTRGPERVTKRQASLTMAYGLIPTLLDTPNRGVSLRA